MRITGFIPLAALALAACQSAPQERPLADPSRLPALDQSRPLLVIVDAEGFSDIDAGDAQIYIEEQFGAVLEDAGWSGGVEFRQRPADPEPERVAVHVDLTHLRQNQFDEVEAIFRADLEFRGQRYRLGQVAGRATGTATAPGTTALIRIYEQALAAAAADLADKLDPLAARSDASI